LQGKAEILRMDSEIFPVKPINNTPLEYRLTVVILGQDDVNVALRDYVGSVILEEFFMMVSKCEQRPA
jgi:hypothetical protein